MKKTLKAFTLLELMVVIAIISVLASILIPNLVGYLEQANAIADAEHARGICTALQTHEAMYGDLDYSNPWFDSSKKTTADNNPGRGYVFVDHNEIRVSSMQIAHILEKSGYIVNADNPSKTNNGKCGKEYVYFADRSKAAYSKIRCRSSRLWNVYQINFNVADSGDLAFSYSAKKGSKTANDAAASKAFAEYCQAGTESKGMEIGR